MIARAGSGHIGSSFSSLDIVTWLYLEELRPRGSEPPYGDLFFSSKGHDVPGLYAVLIGLGRLHSRPSTSCGGSAVCPATPTSARRGS